jgi:hypothetical protein
MPAATREAANASRRKFYQNNREKERLAIRARQEDIRVWFQEYKSALKCERCGFSHPAALDFHHREPALKSYEIPRMVTNGCGKASILAEMAKCEVLCANCHRIHHAPL